MCPHPSRARGWALPSFCLTSALRWMMVVVLSEEVLCQAGLFSVLDSQRETAPLSHTALGCPHYCSATGPFPPQIAPPTA